MCLSLRETELRYDSAWNQLTVIIGITDMERGPVAGRLEEDVAPLNWDDCWAQLENSSPQFQAAMSHVQFARSELAREAVEPIPSLNVQIVPNVIA